jgi:hypothetical protein
MKAKYLFGAAAAALLAGAISYATPSLADPPSWSHGQGHEEMAADRDDDSRDDDHRHWSRQDESEHEHHHHHHHDHDHGRDFRLEEHDRVVIREYIGHHHDKWCPPGLAKKGNNCMPPGQARYRVGEVIPTTVHYEVVPTTVYRSWTPLPPQDVYVRTGSDVYVMDKNTRTIVDAVNLLNDLQ